VPVGTLLSSEHDKLLGIAKFLEQLLWLAGPNCSPPGSVISNGVVI
jgi:hypothetical protein